MRAAPNQARLPFIQVEDRTTDPEAGVSALDYRIFCEVKRRARFRGETDPEKDTDGSMAGRIGVSVGHFRRRLSILRRTAVPGSDRMYLRSSGSGPRRRLIPYDSPLYEAADRRAGAPVPARRRAGSGAPLPYSGIKEGIENVHVSNIPGNPPACVREAAVPGPIEAMPISMPAIMAPVAPAPAPVAPPPAVDGIDADLSGLSPDRLREKLDELEPLTRDPRILVRIRANSTRAMIRGLLEGLEGPVASAPTPRVESLAPRPATAPTPAQAAPKPEYRTLLGRLTRCAGPGPVEDYARFVAEELGDGHSLANHRRIAGDIQAGRIDSRRAWEAYQTARGGKRAGTARSPGAVYTAICRRLE